jgi:hypothetical protein
MVYDLDFSVPRVFEMIEDRYQLGQCNATPQIRGSNILFAQDDVLPSWTTYTGPYNATWRYVQIRIIK